MLKREIKLNFQHVKKKCISLLITAVRSWRLTGCAGRSMGEEISGRYSFLLFILALRDEEEDEEEEAAESASIRPLTRLIIFLAAETENDRNKSSEQ